MTRLWEIQRDKLKPIVHLEIYFNFFWPLFSKISLLQVRADISAVRSMKSDNKFVLCRTKMVERGAGKYSMSEAHWESLREPTAERQRLKMLT